MKIKGSVTIEAAVIVPIFTVIVVQIILLAMECHDKTIINCTSDKLCMEMEFTGFREGRYDTEKMNALGNKGTEYLKNKTIKKSPVISMVSTLFHIETDYSEIEKNNPVEFVWITDAANKLIRRGEE